MGLFKPDYEKPQATEWYYSEKGRKAYEKVDELFKWKHDKFSKTWYFYYYLLSLPNIKKLAENKVPAKIMALAKVMVWLDDLVITDAYGHKEPAPWVGWQNILDKRKNVFLDFASRLNHKLPNTTTINLIVTLCVDTNVDFDGEDSWLFDADFWSAPDDICYEEFIKKLNSFENLHLNNIREVMIDDGTACYET